MEAPIALYSMLYLDVYHTIMQYFLLCGTIRVQWYKDNACLLGLFTLALCRINVPPLLQVQIYVNKGGNHVVEKKVMKV